MSKEMKIASKVFQIHVLVPKEERKVVINGPTPRQVVGGIHEHVRASDDIGKQ